MGLQPIVWPTSICFFPVWFPHQPKKASNSWNGRGFPFILVMVLQNSVIFPHYIPLNCVCSQARQTHFVWAWPLRHGYRPLLWHWTLAHVEISTRHLSLSHYSTSKTTQQVLTLAGWLLISFLKFSNTTLSIFYRERIYIHYIPICLVNKLILVPKFINPVCLWYYFK